jgi:hypothetical protein
MECYREPSDLNIFFKTGGLEDVDWIQLVQVEGQCVDAERTLSPWTVYSQNIWPQTYYEVV